MNPPFNLFEQEAIIIYTDNHGNSVYCTQIGLCQENIIAYLSSENFQRIEKVANQFIIYMKITRRF